MRSFSLPGCWHTSHFRKTAGPRRIFVWPRMPWTSPCRQQVSILRAAGADVPQMAEFRRELLERAKVFYVDFLKQDARNETLRHEMALAHLRVGHINRWLEEADDAAREYEQAIGLFVNLKDQSDKPEYRQGLAGAYNWLGLTLTPVADRAADAETSVQQRARAAGGSHAREPVARPSINRTRRAPATTAASSASRPPRPVLLISARPSRTSAKRSGCWSPWPGALPIQCPHRSSRACTTTSRICWRWTRCGSSRREDLYEAAIRRDEELMKTEPANRVYKMELATLLNNLSYLLGQLGENDLAKARSQQALNLLDGSGVAGAFARHRTGRRAQRARPPVTGPGSARSACQSTGRRWRFMRVGGGIILHTM